MVHIDHEERLLGANNKGLGLDGARPFLRQKPSTSEIEKHYIVHAPTTMQIINLVQLHCTNVHMADLSMGIV